MKKITNFKKSLMIGVIAAALFTAFPAADNSTSTESWFITGSILEENGKELTVINDSDTEVEFGFGFFDFIVDLFS
ncbi:hypothetical protein [Ruminococcus sp. FC2018]|uniref:hypothetical protein n=1 Tax=Ruminococcus sp. FC2018 TaxID=1410617 RepID=UPI00048BFFB9|nr:hypothetical protein [Ruminococcus sp. FC2018]